ncbi:putative adhesin [Vibrio mangrovi]|uniref:Putative adhesin Stv domain-containing protein n=1 Tax=Vibrio mangrovi TaxID=474394 RepID=A0A1Y6IS95_9VIBR|nr:hypothetical protein [Vibrio mangrovi]MDW6003537.1 hypothetical protein [Vibrio mangrovi]SMR99670.1 hypothetical protein VIM7927_00898 [Vibrio mangrovi]
MEKNVITKTGYCVNTKCSLFNQPVISEGAKLPSCSKCGKSRLPKPKTQQVTTQVLPVDESNPFITRSKTIQASIDPIPKTPAPCGMGMPPPQVCVLNIHGHGGRLIDFEPVEILLPQNIEIAYWIPDGRQLSNSVTFDKQGTPSDKALELVNSATYNYFTWSLQSEELGMHRPDFHNEGLHSAIMQTIRGEPAGWSVDIGIGSNYKHGVVYLSDIVNLISHLGYKQYWRINWVCCREHMPNEDGVLPLRMYPEITS